MHYCSALIPYPSLALNSHHRFGHFLIAPSPVHGTSHRILLYFSLSSVSLKEAYLSKSAYVSLRSESRVNLRSGRNCAGWLITTVLPSSVSPSPDFMLLVSVYVRANSSSFATTSPVQPTISLICLVLLPGAAHMSNTKSPWVMFNIKGGSMLTNSCLEITPYSFRMLRLFCTLVRRLKIGNFSLSTGVSLFIYDLSLLSF